MGEILFIIGAYLITSGAKDIRKFKKLEEKQ